MYSSQSPRHSPTPPPHSQQTNNNSFDQDAASSGSSSGSGTASSNSTPRSPSRSKPLRSHRVDSATRFPEAKMETFQSFNAAYNAGPVYISEGLGSPVPGERNSPNSSPGARSASPVHSRPNSQSSGSSHGHGTHPGAHPSHSNPPSQYHRSPDFESLDVSAQLRELHRENVTFKQELDAKDAKLSSSMNSIKTFWSPELKKERALRKEEAVKIQALKEQCKRAVEENQQFSRTIKQLKDELSHQQKVNSHLQTTELSNGVPPSPSHSIHEIESLQNGRENMTKEIFLLKKTAEEREIRIETQKQTLTAREESIKKLLEMLQSKGLSTKILEGDREEADRLRSRLVEAETRVAHLERMMDFREEGLAAHDGRNGETGRSDGEEMRNLRQRVEQLQAELNGKNTEVQGLHTKLDSMSHQYQDQQAHISLLKESLAAKEQHLNMLQADMHSLRNRIDEKEMILAHKDEQLNSMSTDQSKRSGKVNELKEIIDLKERKAAVLQKKIDNMQEQTQEKNLHIEDLRSKLDALEADRTGLEEALTERGKSFSILQEEKEKEGINMRDDTSRLQIQLQEAKTKMDQLHKEIVDKESSLMDMKEHASQLASSGLKKDSKITTLEISLAQTKEELSQSEEDIKKREKRFKAWKDEKDVTTGQQFKDLSERATKSKNESDKLQSEVDRILDIMKEMEGEKNDKDNTIKTLEGIIRRNCPGQLKDNSMKFTTIKKDQQNQKRVNAQLLEEAKKREGDLTTDTHQLQTMVKDKNNRLEELEEALKESVSITADREMILAQQTQTINKLQKQLDETKRTLQAVQKKLSDCEDKLTATQAILEEKDNRLRTVSAEGRKHQEEALETKQEALTAAIGEKDAHIALLELNRKGSKVSDELKSLKKEKDDLVQKLKDETQKRLKLLHHHSNDTDKIKRGLSPMTPDQDEEDGIWA